VPTSAVFVIWRAFAEPMEFPREPSIFQVSDACKPAN
jgi:hypothetical protein